MKELTIKNGFFSAYIGEIGNGFIVFFKNKNNEISLQELKRLGINVNEYKDYFGNVRGLTYDQFNNGNDAIKYAKKTMKYLNKLIK